MNEIKKRRLEEIEVSTHPGTKVGEYVPFYFCPRSIMLFLIYKGNHIQLDYSGGQKPVLHLESDLKTVIQWANRQGRAWAFSKNNAGAYYADFYSDIQRLDQINWNAVHATDFRDRDIKEGKQAEFLVFRSFPWHLIQQIGVIDEQLKQKVEILIRQHSHRPSVNVKREWYY